MPSFKKSSESLVAILVGCVLGIGIVLAAGLAQKTNSIQSQRHELCVTQNARNVTTVKTLKQLDRAAIKRRPGQAKQIEATQANTILLIDDLAPRLDCSKVG